MALEDTEIIGDQMIVAGEEDKVDKEQNKHEEKKVERCGSKGQGCFVIN